MRRLVAVVALIGAMACGGSSSGDASVLIPNVLSSRIQGIDAPRHFQAVLTVMCDSGLSTQLASGFEGDDAGIVFAGAPACGDAALGLEIFANTEISAPVLTFRDTTTGTLGLGQSTVSFTGKLLGELVLSPSGTNTTLCTLVDAAGASTEVTLIDGAPTVTSVPKGSYTVSCDDGLGGLATFAVTVDAGIQLVQRVSIIGNATVTSVIAVNVTGATATLDWAASYTGSVTFAVELFTDSAYAQPFGQPLTTDVTVLDLSGLAPRTHYFVRITPTDTKGPGTPGFADFTTTPGSISSQLTNITIDGSTPTNFSPSSPSCAAFVGYRENNATIVATTLDPDALVSFDGGSTYLPSPATFVTPQLQYYPQTNSFTLDVKTYDGSRTQQYLVGVLTDPG